jgi:hypothetical protein
VVIVKKSKYDVFLSYSRQDQVFVRRLVDRLQESGISVFFDEAEIATGGDLAAALHRVVQEAKYVLIVMSPAYFASQWSQQELALALQEEFSTKRTKVLPLMLRDCEVPVLLRDKLYADFRDPDTFERSFSFVLAAVKEVPVSSIRPKQRTKGGSAALGSISADAADSTELRAMVNDLRTRVEGFLSGSQAHLTSERTPKPEMDPKLCFIVMPFGPEELTDVYEYFIKPSIETQCGLRCERGDDVFGSNVIMDDIRRSIERARIVVADLTGRNPNVFYEVGIAHTMNRDVLLLSQAMSDVPFDLRHRRVLVYDNTPKGCKKLERSIVDNINAILGKGT